MRYDEPKDGEWIRPVKRGYKILCCDCGLAHRVEFRHVQYGHGRGRVIEFRVWRDNRATAAARRRIRNENRLPD